jgi:hypothetical protein
VDVVRHNAERVEEVGFAAALLQLFNDDGGILRVGEKAGATLEASPVAF